MLKLFLLFTIFVVAPSYVESHGMLIQPVNRASRWRFDPTAEPNFNDNELFCGGRGVQWGQNGGKCGLCGDNYLDAVPRRHELGGKYGQGVIVENYKRGEVIPVQARITTSHLGFFEFTMCNIDSFRGESEACFESIRLKQPNGDEKFYIGSESRPYDLLLKLPDALVCNHCVLRWTYTAGNNWGQCGNGTSAAGCGPQETFKTCSDISIA